MRYVTRTSALEYEDFNSAKSRLIERAEKFGEISYKAMQLIHHLGPPSLLPFNFNDSHLSLLQARKIIAMLSQDFIFDGCTILVHGFSRVVFEVLKLAAQNKKLFRVFCTGFCPSYCLSYINYIHIHIDICNEFTSKSQARTLSFVN